MTRARNGGKKRPMRTRLSICRKKARFESEAEARAHAKRSGLLLLPYRCDRCGLFHLTSRTKGKFGRGTSRHARSFVGTQEKG